MGYTLQSPQNNTSNFPEFSEIKQFALYDSGVSSKCEQDT